jgi:hypothetical protein
MTYLLRHRRRALLAAAALLWLSSAAPDAAQAPSLRPLNGVEELKSWFNANREHPRVIFLLSPT